VKKLPVFYGTHRLPCPQKSDSGSCPESHKSAPQPHAMFRIHFNENCRILALGSQSDLFLESLLTKIVWGPTLFFSRPCVSHVLPSILFGVITLQTINGEDHMLWHLPKFDPLKLLYISLPYIISPPRFHTSSIYILFRMERNL
jgi:hypothetical protein